jgi:hypothetical protein
MWSLKNGQRDIQAEGEGLEFLLAERLAEMS